MDGAPRHFKVAMTGILECNQARTAEPTQDRQLTEP